MSEVMHTGVRESTWHDAAVKFRQALEVLEWDMPACLSGERLECGGTDAEHAAAYLGALRAVVEFRAKHLHQGRRGHLIARHAYRDTRGELEAIEAARPCGREH